MVVKSHCTGTLVLGVMFLSVTENEPQLDRRNPQETAASFQMGIGGL